MHVCPNPDIDVLIDMAGFRFLRYFSTVLSSFRYSLETHPTGSNSRGCYRSNSPRTVTEKSLMSLKPALSIAVFGYDSIKLCGVEGRYQKNNFLILTTNLIRKRGIPITINNMLRRRRGTAGSLTASSKTQKV